MKPRTWMWTTLMALFATLALVVTTLPAQAQTLTVLHNFTGVDGAAPVAGLTIDQAGNLYGSAQFGGAHSVGSAFKLAHQGSSWIFTLLYNFVGGSDGALPAARVIFGPDGSLYSTTEEGGTSGVACGSGCGTVFSLKPPPPSAPFGPWTHAVLYRFSGGTDARYPVAQVVFDRAGNLYSTSQSGGSGCSSGCGTVFELTPSGGGWTERVIYSFLGRPTDGSNSQSELIFDSAGNLYGTTISGGAYQQNGTVFKLAPSGSGWIESVLHSFQGVTDGANPNGGLVSDPSGNLYGVTTNADGQGHGGGTVFELTPSMGSWTFNVDYTFSVLRCCQCGPWRTLVMDRAGNLYGTTLCGGAHSFGSVFKLTRSGGQWTYTSLHDFTGGSDGGFPISNLVFDSSGHLYGTASAGGTGSACFGGCGVIFEVTP
jgi:uncharacterized repeat protein (TIGR03803 family)